MSDGSELLLLRLVVIFVVLYFLFSALKSLFTKGTPRQTGGGSTSPEGEEMVFDPQCQSYIPKSTAVMRSGKYFCGSECAQRYLAR